MKLIALLIIISISIVLSEHQKKTHHAHGHQAHSHQQDHHHSHNQQDHHHNHNQEDHHKQSHHQQNHNQKDSISEKNKELPHHGNSVRGPQIPEGISEAIPELVPEIASKLIESALEPSSKKSKAKTLDSILNGFLAELKNFHSDHFVFDNGEITNANIKLISPSQNKFIHIKTEDTLSVLWKEIRYTYESKIYLTSDTRTEDVYAEVSNIGVEIKANKKEDKKLNPHNIELILNFDNAEIKASFQLNDENKSPSHNILKEGATIESITN